ncbi:dihydroorotate dehydrogenase [bacterium]|nr:MAG: dihydroorotate dehydrogenase [bacterium]
MIKDKLIAHNNQFFYRKFLKGSSLRISIAGNSDFFYKLFGKEISGPFTIPSGIVATEVSVLEKIANEVPEIGILTTKSIGLRPREGNREPIIAQHSPLSFINAVGLANTGAEEFAKRLSGITIPKHKFLLISIFGSNELEFQKIAEKLLDHADGFELNVSCPHSEQFGQTIGRDSQLVGRIVKAVLSLGKPVFVKISPNIDTKEVVRQSVEAGVSGITAINTRGPELNLYDDYSILTNNKGGVSGRAILELGLKCVREIREISDLPIIGCGGISTARDVASYRNAGANFLGIGSALAGMDTVEIRKYFHQLFMDLAEGTNKAEQFLKQNLNMNYQKFRIEEKEQIAEDLFFLKLGKKIGAEPGQFIFAWLPREGEKPFSVFDDNPLTLLIKQKGCFTRKLSKLERGDTLYIRGPYGNSPKINGKTLLVGGGTGVAGLYLFARGAQETFALLGAKSKEHLAYEKFWVFCKKVYLTTEDGSLGQKGMATDHLAEVIKDVQPNYCINCGPAPMVETAVRIEKQYIEPTKIYSSIEFLTKCGIGLCGSCATSKGYRSCVDGTFLRQDQI